jgi:hypothetical protein
MPDAPEEPGSPDARALELALVEEATKKSGLVWIAAEPDGTPRAAWHTWFDGAAYLITGGAEQRLPGVVDGASVRVIVRSKDKGGRLVTWRGSVRAIAPGSERWNAVLPQLHADRLNHRDGERQPERWAVESVLLRVEPVADAPLLEMAGGVPDLAGAAARAPMPSGSGAEPVRTSPATTTRRLPRMIGGLPRGRRRRRS